MRVLILGVTGFAGGYLVEELIARGHEVWGAARARPDGTFSKSVKSGGDVLPMVACDITAPESIAAALEQSAPDAVVMLAGLAFAPVSHRDPTIGYQVHAVGAVNVMGRSFGADDRSGYSWSRPARSTGPSARTSFP